jgi:hypothetical protein
MGSNATRPSGWTTQPATKNSPPAAIDTPHKRKHLVLIFRFSFFTLHNSMFGDLSFLTGLHSHPLRAFINLYGSDSQTLQRRRKIISNIIEVLNEKPGTLMVEKPVKIILH